MRVKSLISTSFFRIVASSIALAALPLFCVLIALGYVRMEQSLGFFKDDALHFFQAVADKQNESALTAFTLLESVARVREISSGSTEGRQLLRRLHAKLPVYSNIALYDRDGKLEMASLESGPAAVSRIEVDSLPLASLHKRTGVIFDGEHIIYLYLLDDMGNAAGASYTDGAKVADGGFLAVFVTWEIVRQRLDLLQMSPGFVFHFLDASQRQIFTYASLVANPDNSVHLDDTLRSLISYRKTFTEDKSGPAGGELSEVTSVRDGRGVSYLVSYAGMRQGKGGNGGNAPEPYMYIAIAVDEEQAYSAVRQELSNSLLRIVGGVVGTLILLWTLCSFTFKRPAHRLLQAARDIGEGDYSARFALPRGGAFRDFSTALFRASEELEKYEKNITEASTQARRAERSKSEFLANMSHEIRTPLNAILGMTYLVLKGNLNNNQRGYVNKIQTAGKNLLHVVNDILDFSKMEAGKMGMESIRFAVRDLFGNLAAHYTGRAMDSGVEFEINIAPDVPMYLMGDPLRLEQAIGQLLDHAFRNTWKGAVSVHCSMAGLARSECSLRIAVADTGEGLAPEELELLRAAFANKSQPLVMPEEQVSRLRLEQSRQQSGGSAQAPKNAAGLGRGSGVGLGLTIAHRLFELMNGSIEVSSEPGRGTIFSCTARFVYVEADQSRNSIVLAGKKVLIADSDEISVVLHSSMLNSFSINVKGMHTARQALEELTAADWRGEGYDFFMVDWRNLELDASEIIQRVRHALRLTKVPQIMVISSMGRDELRKMAEGAGAEAFLHKPIDASVLLDTIMGLYGGQELRSMAESMAQVPRQTLEGLRVLLVEDNELNQQLAVDLMGLHGIRVTRAASGVQALRAIADSREDPSFDVVLMDLQMPEMDGFEATWRIRSDTHLKAAQVPIIAMTAHRSPEEISACRKAGMDDYVSKPIDANLFFETLERWLPVLPDSQGLLEEDFQAFLALVKEREQKALARFAAMQGPLRVFAGEGRVKKLQKMLWDSTSDSTGDAAGPAAEAFALHLAGRLYPDKIPDIAPNHDCADTAISGPAADPDKSNGGDA